MIQVQLKNDGALVIPAKVVPNSSFDKLLPYEPKDEWLRIKVKAVPEDGKANDAVIELLADVTGMHKRNIGIARGEASRRKSIEINAFPEPETVLCSLARAMHTELEIAFRLE